MIISWDFLQIFGAKVGIMGTALARAFLCAIKYFATGDVEALLIERALEIVLLANAAFIILLVGDFFFFVTKAEVFIVVFINIGASDIWERSYW